MNADTENTFFPVGKLGWSQSIRSITAIVADFWPHMAISDVRNTDSFERLIFVDEATREEWDANDGDIGNEIFHKVIDIMYINGHAQLSVVHDGSTQKYILEAINLLLSK